MVTAMTQEEAMERIENVREAPAAGAAAVGALPSAACGAALAAPYSACTPKPPPSPPTLLLPCLPPPLCPQVGHDFFIFKDSADGGVKVLYRRK